MTLWIQIIPLTTVSSSAESLLLGLLLFVSLNFFFLFWFSFKFCFWVDGWNICRLCVWCSDVCFYFNITFSFYFWLQIVVFRSCAYLVFYRLVREPQIGNISPLFFVFVLICFVLIKEKKEQKDKKNIVDWKMCIFFFS